jgi:hypothetical protein
MLDFSGISLPFSVTDLLNSSTGLLGLVGGFVLLALVIYFSPIFIQLFRIAIGVYQDNKINANSPKHQISYSQAMKEYLVEDRFYKSKR